MAYILTFRIFLISLLFSVLSACGGASSEGGVYGSEVKQSVAPLSQFSGVAQKGPFEVNSAVLISQLNASGELTGNSIRTKVKDIKGSFVFNVPDSWDIRVGGSALQIKVEGFFLDETNSNKSTNKVSLLSITNDPKSSSVNLLTDWAAKRTQALIKKGKTLKVALQNSEKEVSQIFGINNLHELDLSQFNHQSADNALSLLLSGALLDVAHKNNKKIQEVIDDIARDISNDGKLSGLGNDWFRRMQAVIRNNPVLKSNQYAKALSHKNLNPPTAKHLSKVITLASRPVAILPKEIIAKPGETIILDGSASHDSGNIINFTWFRVDQQTQFNVPVSNRFSDSPTITVPNEEAELLYALVVTDINKLTDTAVIKVIVKEPPPENHPPVAFPQSVATDEDVPLNITLNGTDQDNDLLSFIVNTPLLLAHGLLEGTPPNLVYTPDKNFNGTDKFLFLVSDSFETSNVAVVDITVNPVNDLPTAVINAPKSVLIGEQIDLDGSGSFDIDGTIDSYSWKSSTGENLLGATTHFDAPTTPSTVTVELKVEDNEGATNTTSVDISVVAPPNIPPVANAGVDQTEVFSGSVHTVFLDGSQSNDPDGLASGTDLTYAWEVVSSTQAIALNDTSISKPSFDVISHGTFILKLTVTDIGGAKDSDEVTIVIQAIPNKIPTANDITLHLNQDASNSPVALGGVDDDSGDTVTVVESSIVTTANGTVTKTGSTYNYKPKLGFYGTDTFTYKVTDGKDESIDAATVTIIVNGRPTADAGLPQVLPSIKYFLGSGSFEATQIVLDGSGSKDPEDSINIDYQWTQLSGPATVGSIDGIKKPVINISSTSNIAGDYEFKLVVTDKNTNPSALSSEPSTVQITILSPGNLPPEAVADASPNPAVSGDTIILDGSSSITQPTAGGALTYLWTQTSGPSISGSTIFSSTLEKPEFIAPTVTIPTDFIFSLVVNDGNNDSSAASVTIVVNPINTPPKAIGNTNLGKVASAPVTEGVEVTLSGDLSTDDSGISEYIWTYIKGSNDPVVNLSLVTAEPSKVTFTAPTPTVTNAPLVLTFRLTVKDNGTPQLEHSTDVLVYVNAIPIANAGADGSSTENTEVVLDGSGSSDVEGTPLTYAWTQRPTDLIQLGLGVLTGETPSFTAPALVGISTTTLTFDLIVTDSHLVASQSDSVTITVIPSLLSCPKAKPGVDREVVEGILVSTAVIPTHVTLYGSGVACGLDNSIYGYYWKQVDALGNDITSVDAVTLDVNSSWNNQFPVFIAPSVPSGALALDLYFKLVVEDSYMASSNENDPDAIVKITVLKVGSTVSNQKPVVPLSKTITIPANGTTRTLNLLGTDPDGDDIALSYQIIASSLTPVVGTLGSVSSYEGMGSLSYSPNFPVLETRFNYVAIDEYGVASDPGEIIVTPMVSATPNSNPVANDMNIISYGRLFKNISTLTPFDISDPDPDDYLVVREVSKVENGLFFSIFSNNLNGLNIRVRNGKPPFGTAPYTVPANGEYKYFVVDQFGNTSNIATITVDFRENHQPIAEPKTVSLNEIGNVGDPIFTFNLSGSDPDGHSLRYFLATLPVGDPNVSLSIEESTGKVTFSSLSSSGAFTFTYRVIDEYNYASSAVTVNVSSYVYGP